ncbi:YhcH/YjgK/YiaL family protein [Shewanella sp.]|uniref:YhcH/YjgK/YiaL family protein n=1 Tax=Shewanella sp. TaxID=50422 RepID=UPI003A98587C
MIVDTLANRHNYSQLHSRLAIALDFIATTDFSKLSKGVHKIDGDKLLAIINEYETKPQDQEMFEVHRRYVDVQYVISGHEEFGYQPLTDQAADIPYNAEYDFAKFDYSKHSDKAHFMPLNPSVFAIFFPSDMHMAATLDTPVAVRKVVMKVQLD